MALEHEPGVVILKEGRLRFNSDNFWKKTYDALIKAADGDFGSAIDTMLSSSDAETPEHKAFQLVFRSLHRACVGILTDNNAPDQLKLLKKIERAGLASTAFYHDLSIKLGSGEYGIDKDFIERPQSHPLLKAVQADYTAFLQEVLTISKDQAAALAAVLPNRFVYELFHEWARADYSAVKAYFDNIFFDVLKKESAHKLRHADLLRRFVKPAFNDPRVTLAEMYIEPEFWVHGRCVPKKHKEDFEQVQNAKGEPLHFFRHKQHHDLHKYFLEWLHGRNVLGLNGEAERFLMLLGHPGQGKTSFSLRIVDQMLSKYPNEVESVYLVRLRDISAVENLLSEPLKTLREQPGVRLPDTERLPESEMQNSLLLLDGLDELYMNKGLNLDQIQDFLRRLRQEINTLSISGLRIVLTSRTNSLKLDAHREDDYLVLHLAEFSLEQQLEWLEKYRHYNDGLLLTKEKLSEINQKDKKGYDKLRELVSQPILLQMIAVADFDIDEKANSALIYDRLFNKLIERDWSDDYPKKQLDKYNKLTAKDLRRFLRTLALHIFQKPEGQEYARRIDFENKDCRLGKEVEEIAKIMEMDQLPVKDFARNMLVSAYFQEIERNPDEKRQAGDYEDFAYEFLHKTLQEYLVAEQIWEECRRFFLKKDDDGRFEVQIAGDVMEKIHPLFSPKIITDEIADYLREIVQNDTVTEKNVLKSRLKHFFPELLKNSFLWKHEARRNEPSAMQKILGNFFGYWTLASALIVSHDVDPRDEESFQAAIDVENFFPEAETPIAADLIVLLQRGYSHTINLSHQHLRGAYLRGADLRRADLRGADLREADLRRAYLRGADLSRTDLRRAYLSRTDLRRTDFSGAYLSGTYLSGADLSGAYLSGADLSGAYLSGAYLSGAYLSGAYLRGTYLRGAYLSGAYLRGAYLIGAYLDGAYLDGAYLDEANLSRAYLIGADLSRTDLSRANLSRADLTGADLAGADLAGADLRGADLRGAYLTNADVTDAYLTNAYLSEADLSGATGLETADFTGTIYEGKFSKEK